MCEECEFQTKHRRSLRKHKASKHLNIKFSCNECDKMWKLLTIWRNTHNLNTRVWCITVISVSTLHHVNVELDIISKFKHSLPGSSGFPFNCTQCEHGTTSKYLLTKQQKSKHEDIIYFCNQCKYKTEMQSDLKKHQLTEH